MFSLLAGLNLMLEWMSRRLKKQGQLEQSLLANDSSELSSLYHLLNPKFLMFYAHFIPFRRYSTYFSSFFLDLGHSPPNYTLKAQGSAFRGLCLDALFYLYADAPALRASF
jgi:hypothetical protein